MADTWLILGASSGIGRAFARRAAEAGAQLLLAGRDLQDLERSAADLTIRYCVPAQALPFEARDFTIHAAFAREAMDLAEGPLNILLAAGTMPDQALMEADPAEAAAMVEANFTGAATVLSAFLPLLAAQGSGVVVALGSVAGARGRPRNHLYGASKAALRVFLQGYAARLSRHGVRVLCVQAGPVDTGLTWAMPGLPFIASPEAFAGALWRAAQRGRGEVHVPRIWAPVMGAIRALPDRVFNRLDF